LWLCFLCQVAVSCNSDMHSYNILPHFLHSFESKTNMHLYITINKERCTLIKYTNCTFLLIKTNCIFHHISSSRPHPWMLCLRMKLWTMASYTWYIPGAYSNICTLGIWVVFKGLYEQVAVTIRRHIGINAACRAQKERILFQLYLWNCDKSLHQNTALSPKSHDYCWIKFKRCKRISIYFPQLVWNFIHMIPKTIAT